ncbi:hypothetical protein [Polyangium sorediatum]|uniref:Peptidase metallopeptidase domain-containing protein n=1 Tax=Polyangium sorediatum TaxID=889274 RepID=A0ABT6P269_9BACT|nr:hypothetical protein [Polyangium sorediatum]MDI1434648.1 hypothetical protein [Polyangium sorediatum]
METRWGVYSRVNFTGWGSCDASTPAYAIRIRIEDTTMAARAYTGRSAFFPSMWLNFDFQNWNPACQNQREHCIRSIAIHEFGHALSFYHEQDSPGNNGQCTSHVEVRPDGVMLTQYDPDSSMNYCYPYRETLSPLDIQGLRVVYGPDTLVEPPVADRGYGDRRWMADFNGDGKADYCRAVGNSSGSGSYLSCSLSNGSGFSGDVLAPVGDWGYGDRRWMADFNGDGKADYCRATGNSSGAGSYLRCSLSNGSGFSGDVLAPVGDWGYGDRRWMADFNGDGKADYCRAVGNSSGAGSNLGCSLSNGAGFSGEVLAPVGDWGYGDRRWMADFNGDGKADYCRAVGNSSGAGSNLGCSLSNGSGFSGQVLTPVGDWGYGDRRWMVDFNGDSKVDYCRAVGSSDGYGAYLGCALSTGAGFSGEHQTPVQSWGSLSSSWWADFDGNGRPDFCRFMSGLACSLVADVKL